jgi:hypothetical protein
MTRWWVLQWKGRPHSADAKGAAVTRANAQPGGARPRRRATDVQPKRVNAQRQA